MRRLILAFSLAACVALSPACGSSDVAEPTAFAAYEGSRSLAPWPSDHFLTAGRVSAGAVTRTNPFVVAWPATESELEQRDGFSTIGGAFVSFTEELDVSDLLTRLPSEFATKGTPLALVDVDSGRAVPLVVRYVSSSEDERGSAPDFMLVIEPAAPLEPKTRHVLVLGDGLLAKSGAKIAATQATRALVSGDAEGEYGAALRAALPTALRASGIDRDRVVLATMFTTASVRDDLAHIAASVRAEAPPVGRAAILEKRATDPGDARVRFSGAFAAPEYRAPKPDGKWHVEDGVPRAQSNAMLEYFLTFTNGARSGPRPVVVLGHGLGRDRDMGWEVAQLLSELDVVVISIDAPEHGSRHVPPFPPGQTDQVVSTLGFIGVDLDTKAIDVGIARDNFRQLASDQLHLLRFLSSLGSLDVLPAGAPDGAPDIDPNRVFYMGISFGAVVGATVLSFSPEIRAACLTVGGAPLGTILRSSGTLRILVDSILPQGASGSDLERFVSMAQGVIDPGDPINYAPFVASRPMPGVTGWRGADVLLQEAIADAIIPNAASEMLARALGVAQVGPTISPIAGLRRAPRPLVSVDGAPVGGVLQLDRAGGEPANHRTFYGTPEARQAYVAFLRSAIAGERATIE